MTEYTDQDRNEATVSAAAAEFAKFHIAMDNALRQIANLSASGNGGNIDLIHQIATHALEQNLCAKSS